MIMAFAGAISEHLLAVAGRNLAGMPIVKFDAYGTCETTSDERTNTSRSKQSGKVGYSIYSTTDKNVEIGQKHWQAFPRTP